MQRKKVQGEYNECFFEKITWKSLGGQFLEVCSKHLEVFWPGLRWRTLIIVAPALDVVMVGRWVWVWDMIKVRCRKHSREPGLPTLDIYQSMAGPGLCHGDEKMTQTWQTRVRCHITDMMGYLAPIIFYHRSLKNLRSSVFWNSGVILSFEVVQVINCGNILCLMAGLLWHVPVSSPRLCCDPGIRGASETITRMTCNLHQDSGVQPVTFVVS